MKVLVTKSTGSWYEVLDSDGFTHKARLRGKFKIQGLKVSNPIAVGDWVEISIQANDEYKAIINEIYPRENYIVRQSVHKSNQGHLIASNIDQSVLVATLHQPRTSLGFIDRFLVSAEAFRIPAVLVFNKIDLYSSADLEELKNISEIYQSIGYTVLCTSTYTGEGISELQSMLTGKKSLFSGHSGVGKSSLLNVIHPSLSIRTSEISRFADKGVHTTTFAEMFNIGSETYLIDTPGIKELGIFEIGNDELAHYFPEMRVLIGCCKFHNCKHINEPNCAVIKQVNDGIISESRYKSYLSMIENKDSYR